MPRIPEVSPQVRPDLMPTPRRGAEASPNAFGAQTAQAIGQAGRQMAEIGLEMQKQQDVIRVQKAFTQAQKDLHDYQNDSLMLKGINAVGLKAKTEKTIQEIADRHAKGLNQNQRRQFDQFFSRAGLGAVDSMTGHERRETQRAMLDQGNAILKQQVDAVLLARNNDEQLAVADQTAVTTIDTIASSQGWTKEQRDAAVREQRTAMNFAVVTQLIEDGPAGIERAKKIFDRVEKGGGWSVREALTLTNKIKGVEDQVEAQTVSQEMLAKHGDNERAALAEIRKRYSGAKQNLMVQYTEAMFADARRLEKQEQNAVFDEGLGLIRSAKSFTQAITMIENLEIENKDKATLENYARSHFKVGRVSRGGGGQGGSRRSSKGGYRGTGKNFGEFLFDVADDSGEETFLRTQETMDYYRRNVGSYDNIADFRRDAARDGIAGKDLQSLEKFFVSGGYVNDIPQTAVDGAVKRLGMKPDSHPGLITEVAKMMPRDRKPTTPEIEKAVHTLLMTKVKEEDWVFDNDISLLKGLQNPSTVAVPEKAAKAIAANLEKNGIKPTRAKIQEIYLENIRRQR